MSFDRWFEDRVETTRIDLGNGNYIDVANYITGEEELTIRNAGLRGVRHESDPMAEIFDEDNADPTVKKAGSTLLTLDAARQKFVRMLVYIKGWNAKKADGSPVPVSYANLRRLSREALDQIDAALDKHIEAMHEGKAPVTPTGAASSTLASISAD